MVMKINGVDSNIMPPSVYGRPYVFKGFDDLTMTTEQRWVKRKKTEFIVGHLNEDVKKAVQKVWLGVVNRSTKGPCNEYFKSLPYKKSLTQILSEGDFMIYRLVPKEGYDRKVLPHACVVGRDIGLDPDMLFVNDPQEVICTLIHEIAHIGGALTDRESYDPELPLAAEKALKECNCLKYYQEGMLGLINVRSGGKLATRAA
jgi:hypothetical protein